MVLLAITSVMRLAKELAYTDFSRGAIYRAQLWLEGLTDDEDDVRSERWKAQLELT